MSYYHEDLAYIHDAGFGELTRQATPVILAALRQSGGAKSVVVELGCGGGWLLAALAGEGYRAVGVEASAAMLAMARARAPRAELVHGSLYEVEIPPCAGVFAVGEALNYVGSMETVPPTARLFARVAAALPAGAPFLFDAIVRHPKSRRAYRSWLEGSDWAVLFAAEPAPAGTALRRGITTFREKDGAYRRGHEDHHVHLFSRRLLTAQLRRAGFQVSTSLCYGPAPLPPGRVLFACRREPSP